MVTACFSVMVQLLLLMIRIAIRLRLSIPLVYLVLMLTVFQPWYRAHAAFADGIFLVLAFFWNSVAFAMIFSMSCPHRVSISLAK